MWNLLIFLLSVMYNPTSSQKWLRADGTNDAYALIDKMLGANATALVPDCKHQEKHITMANDKELQRPVFLFHTHVDLDGDFCQTSTTQRTQITIGDPASDTLKGFNLETAYHSWNFKLDAKFQASEAFTHIHQLNVRKRDIDYPIVAIDVRKGNPDLLRIVHIRFNGRTTILGQTELDPFKGTWVHVQQNSTYSNRGIYSVTMTKVSDGLNLFNITQRNLDMWRNGAAYVIPKWGTYRNLSMKNELRDEIVKYDNFCLGKGTNVCQ